MNSLEFSRKHNIKDGMISKLARYCTQGKSSRKLKLLISNLSRVGTDMIFYKRPTGTTQK